MCTFGYCKSSYNFIVNHALELSNSIQRKLHKNTVRVVTMLGGYYTKLVSAISIVVKLLSLLLLSFWFEFSNTVFRKNIDNVIRQRGKHNRKNSSKNKFWVKCHSLLVCLHLIICYFLLFSLHKSRYLTNTLWKWSSQQVRK